MLQPILSRKNSTRVLRAGILLPEGWSEISNISRTFPYMIHGYSRGTQQSCQEKAAQIQATVPQVQESLSLSMHPGSSRPSAVFFTALVCMTVGFTNGEKGILQGMGTVSQVRPKTVATPLLGCVGIRQDHGVEHIW